MSKFSVHSNLGQELGGVHYCKEADFTRSPKAQAKLIPNFREHNGAVRKYFAILTEYFHVFSAGFLLSFN